MTEIEVRMQTYDLNRDEIFDYFNYKDCDYGVELNLKDKWFDDGSTLYWKNEDEYSEDIYGTSKYSGEDYTLFVLNLCTGGKGISIFKNSNYEEYETEW